ncbi:MAG: hypothetical protein KZQ93_06780 [Candidatus Thiodiazotropha sp. (ex Monitilora ramsayi)]|nr:hypothetical protein [Candidatus Thiodiazotropha sp. (ex Monitilora ramsayi)]
MKLKMLISGFAGGCIFPIIYIANTILRYNHDFELSAILAVVLFGVVGGVFGFYSEKIVIIKFAISLLKKNTNVDIDKQDIVHDAEGAAFIAGMLPSLLVYAVTSISLDEVPPYPPKQEDSHVEKEAGIIFPRNNTFINSVYASSDEIESKIISVPESKYKHFGMIPTVVIFPESANRGVPYYIRNTYDIFNKYYRNGHYTFSVILENGETKETILTDLPNGSSFKFYTPENISEFSISFDGIKSNVKVPEEYRGSALIDFYYQSKRIINFSSVLFGKPNYVLNEIKSEYIDLQMH